MKKILSIYILFISLGFQAQTGKEIIEKNIELSGGITNWKLLNTVTIHGKVILGINDEYPIKIYQARPNLTKTVMVVNKKETPIAGYDGKRGYGMHYASNTLQEYSDYIAESFDNDFIDFENKGFFANYLGKEKVGNSLCHKVELVKNVNKNIYYFDNQTYMLIKEEKKDETLLYTDYKKVGNLLFPFRIESSNPAKDSEFVMMVNKIETNRALPENTFKFK